MIVDNFIIRKATINDIDFIVNAIIHAEKSGSEKNGFASLFNLSDEIFGYYIKKILEEGIDGCELSLSSFLLAIHNGIPIATVGGWMEGYPDGISSAILKSNLINFTFPKESILIASKRQDVFRELQIEREFGCYQIEYVYVNEIYRGNGISKRLILEHFELVKNPKLNINKSQVQVLGDNINAIKVYENLGFILRKTNKSTHPDILKYISCNRKLLMEINI